MVANYYRQIESLITTIITPNQQIFEATKKIM